MDKLYTFPPGTKKTHAGAWVLRVSLGGTTLLLLLGVKDKLREQASNIRWSTHVRPCHVSFSVCAVRDVDVIPMEDCTTLTTWCSRLEITRMGRIGRCCVDNCLRARDLH